MDTSPQQRTRHYIAARQQHPAWLLLASPRAPLVLGCLTSLFEFSEDGIAEAARQSLPTITPLMMSEAYFKAFYRDGAVPEPVHAELPTSGLTEREVAFFHFLKAQPQGRLEQEYLP